MDFRFAPLKQPLVMAGIVPPHPQIVAYAVGSRSKKTCYLL